MESLALFSTTTTFTSPNCYPSRRALLKSTPSISLSLTPRSTDALRSPASSPTPFFISPLRFSHFKTKPFLSPPKSSQNQSQTSSEKNPSPSPAASIQGAKLLPLAISVAIGLIVRFLVPKPVEVSLQAWQLLSIFLSTITGLVLGPLPGGACSFLALTTSVVTKTLTFSAAFSAFTSDVIWLIVISFFFARGFVKTGLGDRIATYFVKWLGKSTLGLSYGLTISETLIAPAMPSTTARAGGVFLPIIQSLSLSSGSRPSDPSSKKLGAYLVQSQFQSTCSEL